MSPLPVFREPTPLEKVFNRAFGFVVGLGLGPSHIYVLEVRGRKSGKLYSTPVDLLELGGKRFLVAPREASGKPFACVRFRIPRKLQF